VKGSPKRFFKEKNCKPRTRNGSGNPSETKKQKKKTPAERVKRKENEKKEHESGRRREGGRSRVSRKEPN